MSAKVASLRHQINSTKDLESVVGTMKAIASSSITQYENAVLSLDDYYSTVQLGLAACFQQNKSLDALTSNYQREKAAIGVIVFGSDQGLVGQFNEVMLEFIVDSLAKMPGDKVVWPIGERLRSRLTETSLKLEQGFILPNSIKTISSLVAKILIEIEAQTEKGAIEQVYVFHHRPQTASSYIPVIQKLLPLDQKWIHTLSGICWPTNNLPEIMPIANQTLSALIREYLFVSIFRACAESLASENASRLAAMQRAEKNIDELQENLNQTFHRLRQTNIDEELFDVLAGFESLS